jgi:hypothetical protein
VLLLCYSIFLRKSTIKQSFDLLPYLWEMLGIGPLIAARDQLSSALSDLLVIWHPWYRHITRIERRLGLTRALKETIQVEQGDDAGQFGDL